MRCFLACLAGKHIIVATTVTAHGRDVGRGGAPRGGHPGIRGGGQHEGPGEHASHAGARGHQGGAPVSSRRARVHRRGRGFVAQAVAAVERARALVPGVERRRVVRAVVVGERRDIQRLVLRPGRRALEPGDSPAGPAFVKIILPRHVGPEGRLPAPAGLADFLPPTARSLALVCDGESWRCTWSVGRDAAGASLAGNWRGFAEDQRLEPGDAVTLKKEAGATLRVTIHRARASGALSRDAPGSFYDASCVKTRGEKDRRTHGTKTNEAGGLNRAFRARAGWIAAFAGGGGDRRALRPSRREARRGGGGRGRRLRRAPGVRDRPRHARALAAHAWDEPSPWRRPRRREGRERRRTETGTAGTAVSSRGSPSLVAERAFEGDRSRGASRRRDTRDRAARSREARGHRHVVTAPRAGRPKRAPYVRRRGVRVAPAGGARRFARVRRRGTERARREKRRKRRRATRDSRVREPRLVRLAGSHARAAVHRRARLRRGARRARRWPSRAAARGERRVGEGLRPATRWRRQRRRRQRGSSSPQRLGSPRRLGG